MNWILKWWTRFPILLVLQTTLLGGAGTEGVRINEFMASNGSTIADEDGDFEDWIELFNAGSGAVDLSGWALSDDLADPMQWRFPDGAVIGPDEYLLVWASGKDRADPAGGGSENPHTNFRIAGEGERLLLADPAGRVVDAIGPVAVPRDVSYGRTRDDPAAWAFFYEPTPGAANATQPFTAPIEPVRISHQPGFYAQPLDVVLSHSDPEVTILYTLDGSDPEVDSLDGVSYETMESYPNGALQSRTYRTHVYGDPIPVEDRSGEANRISRIATTADSNPIYIPRSPVKKATVIRARAYRDGAQGEITTATFFVSDTGAFDYSLPIVSLSLSPDRLFDFHDGIYVSGVDYLSGSGGRICSWGNYNRRGIEAERAAHFQYFDSGTVAIDQGVGVRIQGNCSRQLPFKSLRLYARNRYGDDTIHYRFFADPVPHAVRPMNSRFRRLVLRTPNMNDVVFTRLFQPVYEGVMGRLQPAIQFINGEYWGLSYVRDRFDKHHLAHHYDLDPENVAIINLRYRHEEEPDMSLRFGDRIYNVSAGIPSDLELFHEMREFVVESDMSDDARYAEARERLCIDSFIDHLVVKIFAGDDHYAPEFVYWRAREAEDDHIGDGRWRVLVKDFDSTLRSGNYLRRLATGTHPRPFGSEVFQSLLENESFRHAFINRFADLLNAHLRTDRFDAIIASSYEEVIPYWEELRSRWYRVGLSNPHRPFTEAVRQELVDWSRQHPARQREHIRSYFGIPDERTLTVRVSDPEHGHVRVNTIDVHGETPGIRSQPYPWKGAYFDGVPVELEAVPGEGYRLSGWLVHGTRTRVPEDGTPAYHSVEARMELTLTEDTTVEAVFEPIPAAERSLVLHQWDFEDAGDPLAPSATIGGGALTINPGPETAALSNTGGDFPTRHLRINNPIGSTVTLDIPTVGYERIELAYETRRSGQGAGLQTLAYTTDGIVWTEVTAYPVYDRPPRLRTFDFSSEEAVDDNPAFAVRITFAEGGGGSAGNNRFDNVTVAGVEVWSGSIFRGSDGTLDLGHGWRWNSMGYFYDTHYPFVFAFGLDTWIYVIGDSEESYYFWSYTDEAWVWTGRAHYPSFLVLTGDAAGDWVDPAP